jgi:hypothetical protein
MVRLQPAQLAALDAWIARQDAQLSRPEAIRRLLEQALAVSQPVKSRTQKARSTALDLASTQVDRLLDPSAPDEERQRRKRRLLKGPKEFRDMRDAVRSRSKRLKVRERYAVTQIQSRRDELDGPLRPTARLSGAN